MKTFCLFFLLSQLTFSQHFSELNGMEDYNGSTNLFYRIYEYKDLGGSSFTESRNIYNLNFEQNSDTLFFSDYNHSPADPLWSSFVVIYNYDFWDDDPTKYIYTELSGTSSKQNSIQSPITIVKRYDVDYPSHQNFSQYAYVEISKKNDSILYGSNGWFIKSSDGGLTWSEHESDDKIFQSISSWNDSTLFFVGYDSRLFKSTDGGVSTFLVDTAAAEFPNNNSKKFLYDQNYSTVYRLIESNNNYSLRVSNNKGEAFTWSSIFTSDIPIYAAVDLSHSGHIYLARDKFIYKSTDHGNSFEIIKQLKRKVVGIYKKPNSEKLYAADKYKIYEIENDSIKIIKQLPIPDDIFNFFPLAVGNKWVYDEIKVENDILPVQYNTMWTKEIVGKEIKDNGKEYFIYEIKNYYPLYQLENYERVDSSGIVWRYADEYPEDMDEYLALDLTAEIGDSLNSYFYYGGVVLEEQKTFSKWDITDEYKTYKEYQSLFGYSYTLLKQIGMDSISYSFDFGYSSSILKGAIINGVVYGDTTLVGIDDEEKLPISFKLSQNYPNPFNPTTSIKYSVPSLQFTIIKVYDVLGNEVTILVNEIKSPGEYEVEFNGSNLSSGVYFYQLNAGNFTSIKKMIYLK